MRSSETPLWIVAGTKIESGCTFPNSFPSELPSSIGFLFWCDLCDPYSIFAPDKSILPQYRHIKVIVKKKMKWAQGWNCPHMFNPGARGRRTAMASATYTTTPTRTESCWALLKSAQPRALATCKTLLPKMDCCKSTDFTKKPAAIG